MSPVHPALCAGSAKVFNISNNGAVKVAKSPNSYQYSLGHCTIICSCFTETPFFWNLSGRWNKSISVACSDSFECVGLLTWHTECKLQNTQRLTRQSCSSQILNLSKLTKINKNTETAILSNRDLWVTQWHLVLQKNVNAINGGKHTCSMNCLCVNAAWILDEMYKRAQHVTLRGLRKNLHFKHILSRFAHRGYEINKVKNYLTSDIKSLSTQQKQFQNQDFS